MDLWDKTDLGHLDWHLVNVAGQTPADLAVILLAELPDDSEDRPQESIRRLMRLHAAMWSQHVQPVLQLCFDEPLPVADLAKLTLGYVDGSGPPFVATAAADADVDVAETGAAAAAAQS